MRQGNYTSSGLTLEEKKELESLRNKVRYYRQLDSYIQKDDEIQKNKDENSDSEEDDDIMDSIEEEKIEKKNPKYKKIK